MSRFDPTLQLRRAYDITPGLLREMGVSALILDIDNTLTTHGSPEISPQMAGWLEEMRREGIRLMLLSNNSPSRVEPFARKLRLDYIANGAKPLKGGFQRCIDALGVPKQSVALVGDQLYTDILGGNRFGIRTILVEPIELERQPFLRLKRVLERRHLRAYRRRQAREEDR